MALAALASGAAVAQSLHTLAIQEVASAGPPNSEKAFGSVEIHERPAPVDGQAWPEAARGVIARAGLAPPR